MRIGNAGDHLEVFAESAEHIPAVLVDLFGRRRWPVFGKHAVTGFEGLARRGSRLFLGQFS